MSFDRMGQCHCPTCGAVQNWQKACRRCRTELDDLWRIAEEIIQLRSRCFSAIRNNEWQRSECLARQLRHLHPTVFHRVLHEFIKHKLAQ